MSGPDDQDFFEDPGPRSIFAATWFRVVLVVIVFAVIGAVSVPYILDYMNPPPKPVVAPRPPVPIARPDAVSQPAPASAPMATPPQSSVPTAMPAQPAPQSAMPAQPAPKTAMPPQKSPTTVAPAPAQSRATPPVVAQAPSKAEPVPPVAKPAPPGPKEEKATKPAAAKTQTPKRTVAKAATTGTGSYWVQLGAFRDPDTAKRVAAKVGAQNVVVVSTAGGDAAPAASAQAPAAPAESKEAIGGGDLYDVFVSGGLPADISRRLAGKGLASEATAGGVVVRPSQPLREAVALSKDLAVEGFKVQVRRAGGAAARPAPAPAKPAAVASATGQTLYRVRVGPYSERAAAVAALHDLDAKGYRGFIARGEQ